MADTLGPLRPDEEKIYEGQPKGFPLGDYKTYLEDIMLPEGDDLGIPSDDDSIGDDEIETETGFGSVIGECLVVLQKEGFWLPCMCYFLQLSCKGRPHSTCLQFCALYGAALLFSRIGVVL